MFVIRRSSQRRHLQCGAQETWQTFFSRDDGATSAEGFGFLVALEEMRLPPGASTASHVGDETEMLTYIYRGALSQEDSRGRVGLIQAGEFQWMSTGHRIRHRETNASRSEWAHVFRIFLRPWEVGLEAQHEEQRFTVAERRNTPCVVASADGRKGSLQLHQDVVVCSSMLDEGHHFFYALPPERTAWLHLVDGEATVHDEVLTGGDGVGVVGEPALSLTVQEHTEVLLVDLGPPRRP